jgi:hypothetical protein
MLVHTRRMRTERIIHALMDRSRTNPQTQPIKAKPIPLLPLDEEELQKIVDVGLAAKTEAEQQREMDEVANVLLASDDSRSIDRVVEFGLGKAAWSLLEVPSLFSTDFCCCNVLYS